MKAKLIFFLFFVYQIAFSQNENEAETILTFSPIIAYGISLPSKVNVLSGNQQVTYIPTSRITGSLVSSAGGTTSLSFFITNTIGFEANYKIKSPIWLNFSLTRSSQINSSQNPFDFQFANGTVRNWYSITKYYNFNIAPRKTWDKGNGKLYFGQLGIGFSTGFKSPFDKKESSNKDVGNFVENGTGVKIDAFNGRKNTFVLNPEFGYRAHESFPLDLSLAVTIPLTPIYTERYTFFQNGKQTGANQVNLNQTVLWLRARYTIDVLKRKERKEKPKKPEKIKEEKVPVLVKEKVDFGNKKITEGEKIVLKNITFDQTKSVLNSSGMTELDIVGDLMKQYPKMRIEITGHTSNEGDRYDNIELSRKRADACKEYLRKKGIEAFRIQTRGLGPDAPLSTTDKSLNRRVELTVLKVY